MIYVICAVRDSAVASYLRPFFTRGVGEAVRSFGDEVLRGADSILSAHPEDFELFELGHFDDESGRFSLLSEPRALSRGKDHKEVSHGNKAASGAQAAQRPGVQT